MTDNHIALLKTSIKVFLGIAILLILLFGSAGTFYWIEAWILIIFYLLTVLIAGLWLRKNDPDLLRERTSRKSEGKLWDKILLFIYTILLYSKRVDGCARKPFLSHRMSGSKSRLLKH